MKILSAEDEEILGVVDPESITAAVHRHSSHPDHLGILDDADGASLVTGMCEDTVMVQLRLKEKTIVEATFRVQGCGFTIACGNIACELVTGNSITSALRLDGAAIDQALGGLPKGHRHCADLAAKAMQTAAKNALFNQRDPWRPMYGSRR